MIEFCTCGSLIVDGKCTNRNCAHRIASDAAEAKKPRKSAARKPKEATAKTTPATAKAATKAPAKKTAAPKPKKEKAAVA